MASTTTLSRKKAQRNALVKVLASSLILDEQITTTKAKAKILLPKLEKLISTARQETLSSKRKVASFLPDVRVQEKLTTDIAKRFKNHDGGYIRKVRAGKRFSDQTELVTLSFTKQKVPSSDTKTAKKATPTPKKVKNNA